MDKYLRLSYANCLCFIIGAYFILSSAACNSSTNSNERFSDDTNMASGAFTPPPVKEIVFPYLRLDSAEFMKFYVQRNLIDRSKSFMKIVFHFKMTDSLGSFWMDVQGFALRRDRDASIMIKDNQSLITLKVLDRVPVKFSTPYRLSNLEIGRASCRERV